MNVRCRGIRGATSVAANTREAILSATEELLAQIVAANGVEQDDIVSVIFTVTQDLNAEFPAVAARRMGWNGVAMLCGHEIAVPGSLGMCLRVLMHINTAKAPGELVHIYLGEARSLRPDLSRNHD